MTSNKLVVFLCLAALATCGQARTSIAFSEANLGDIFDVAVEAFNNLTETVIDAVIKSVYTVQRLNDQLVSTANVMVLTLTENLGGVVEGLVEQVNKLAAGAAAKGLDPAACVGTSLTDLKDLRSSTAKKVTDCLETKVDDTSKVINEKLRVINSVITDLTAIETDITDCGHQSILLQPICFTQVTADIESKLISLPAKVTSALASSTTILLKSIAGLAKCELGVVDDVTATGTTIVQKVTDCISKL